MDIFNNLYRFVELSPLKNQYNEIKTYFIKHHFFSDD